MPAQFHGDAHWTSARPPPYATVSNTSPRLIPPSFSLLAPHSLTHIDLEMDNLTHLKSLTAAENQIEELPEDIGSLNLLASLNLRKNAIREIPQSFSQLKKLKVVEITENPIKDQKVVKMFARGGKGLKELGKYLLKQKPKKKGGKKKAAGAVEEASVLAAAVEAATLEDGKSDDSSDIDPDDL